MKILSYGNITQPSQAPHLILPLHWRHRNLKLPQHWTAPTTIQRLHTNCKQRRKNSRALWKLALEDPASHHGHSHSTKRTLASGNTAPSDCFNKTKDKKISQEITSKESPKNCPNSTSLIWLLAIITLHKGATYQRTSKSVPTYGSIQTECAAPRRLPTLIATKL